MGEFEYETLTLEDESTQKDEAIKNLLIELGSDTSSSINVYSTRPGTRKLEYLFCCDTGEYDYGQIMERLKQEYGAGEYRVQVRSANKLVANHPVWVGESKTPEKEGSNDLDGIKQTLQSLAESQKILMDAMINNNQKQVDPITMQQQLLKQMLTMKEFLGVGQVHQSPPPQADPLKTLKDYVEFKSVLDGVIGGEKDNNTNDVLVSLINNVLPQLGEMSKAEQEINLINARNKAKNIQQIGAKKEVKSGNPMQGHLMFLTNMAAKNVDVEAYSNIILDQTSDEQWLELKRFLSNPDAVQELIAMHPPVAQYQEWFENLRQTTLAMMVEEEKELDQELEKNVNQAVIKADENEVKIAAQ